jgi:hypothetical protein
VYAALRQAAFVETVQYWRLLLTLYDQQGGARADLATLLDVPAGALDGVPSAYWFQAMWGILRDRQDTAPTLQAQPWSAAHIAELMPLTAQAAANLPTTI